MKDLAEEVGLPERRLRERIAEIRRSDDTPLVISSSAKGYWVVTKEEAEKANQRLYRQAFSLLKTAYATDRKMKRDGQFHLKIDEMETEIIRSFGE